jgi:hypothetical protein
MGRVPCEGNLREDGAYEYLKMGQVFLYCHIARDPWPTDDER